MHPPQATGRLRAPSTGSYSVAHKQAGPENLWLTATALQLRSTGKEDLGSSIWTLSKCCEVEWQGLGGKFSKTEKVLKKNKQKQTTWNLSQAFLREMAQKGPTGDV